MTRFVARESDGYSVEIESTRRGIKSSTRHDLEREFTKSTSFCLLWLYDERHPLAVLFNLKLGNAASKQRRLDQLELRLEDAGEYQLSTRQTHQRRQQSNNHIRSQICADQIG